MALVAAAAVLFMPLGLAPAHAEPDYPPHFYKITAQTYNARVGQTVGFTAQTYEAGSKVAVDVAVDGKAVGKTATVTANAKGIARASVTFTVEGVNTVTMSGTSDKGDALALSADVTVTADEVVPVDGGSDAGGTGVLGLPRTGGQIAATALVAAGLLGLGFLLVLATRRRHA